MWAKIEMAILYCSFTVGMTTKRCTATTVLATVKYFNGKRSLCIAKMYVPRALFLRDKFRKHSILARIVTQDFCFLFL
jgi:hypothetical protein